jgi:hypothetical protein
MTNGIKVRGIENRAVRRRASDATDFLEFGNATAADARSGCVAG